MGRPTYAHGHLIRHTIQTYEMAGGGKFCPDSLWDFRAAIEVRLLKLAPGEMYEVKVHPRDWDDFLCSLSRDNPFFFDRQSGDTFQFMGFRITIDHEQPVGEWHFLARVIDTVEAIP